ncbi:RraA family protein [Actibacterium sp.]|uniref:RraA family protein n=1 Tax=Actibacterium sp. TaxID=1872125 RepID=UPI003569DF50
MSTPESARQPDEAVTRLRRLDCCAVSDALDLLGLAGQVTGVPKRSGSAAKIAGRVITLKLHDGPRPDGPLRHLGTTAVELSDTDTVIVVEQRSGKDAGCWGGLLTLGAKLRGAAGVVADGPVRDIDEAREYDFPIFSTSLTARTARGRVVEAATNGPIVPWGVPVEADDYVIADSSAVIFIPAAKVNAVLDAAEAIAFKEAVMAKALLAGKPISLVMSGDYENMLEGGDK